jgi:hypothetical protein
MTTNNVFAWSGTAGSNADVAGNGITGSSNISLGNDVFQNIMAQITNGMITRGSDIATASTVDFTAATTPSLLHDLTGTTTVTAVTMTAGWWRLCRAQGAFQITASSTLVVNGSTSTNYTTTAGDLLIFFGYSASTVRVWAFSGGTASQATTSAYGTTKLATLAQTLAQSPAGLVPTIENLFWPTGHLYGCQVINNAGSAANKIDVPAGTIRDSTDTYDIIVPSITAKDITSAWAVGSSAGLLDTGSVANTTYYVYAIKRLDTGVVDVIGSTSSSSPTLPSNYTVYSKPIARFVRAAATNGIPTLMNRHPEVELTGSAPVGACRAWVNFNGSSGAIAGSFNVSSVTKTATGNYTVNLTSAMPDANYSSVGSAGTPGTSQGFFVNQTLTTTTVPIFTPNSGGTLTDYTVITAAVFR